MKRLIRQKKIGEHTHCTTVVLVEGEIASQEIELLKTKEKKTIMLLH